jgi:nucleotide-binding universal stress UspA family protein
MFNRLCLAFAFSPRAETLLFEAVRLTRVFNGHLTVLHVGQCTIEEKGQILALLIKHGLNENQFAIVCEAGSPSKVILSVCKREKIDLLVAGALQKENIIKYYLGTIGRTILRKADCSVLMLTNPTEEGLSPNNIVALAEDSPYIREALAAACLVGNLLHARWLHIVREIKMYGLTLSASEQASEEEYNLLRQQLVKTEIEQAEEFLKHIPHEGMKINIKVVSGKAGFELARFAERKHADLLVVGAPGRKYYFIDRLFRHDLEYIFADMPCNLLVVHPRKGSQSKKEVTHG